MINLIWMSFQQKTDFAVVVLFFSSLESNFVMPIESMPRAHQL